MITTTTSTKTKTVKITKLDSISKSIGARIWDPSLKKSIDEYPEINVDLSRLNLDGDILEQLSELLSAQLDYQKSLEANISQTHINKINQLIGTVTDVPEIYKEPESQDRESLLAMQDEHRLEWELLNNQIKVGTSTTN